MLGLILVLIIIGVLLNYIPMDGSIKQILYLVIAVAVIIVLLDLLGLWHLRFGRW